jgi:hypothetical protein
MARAHSIWVVLDSAYGIVSIMAAFTVKRELKSWLAKQDTERLHLHIYKCPDNTRGYFGHAVKEIYEDQL